MQLEELKPMESSAKIAERVKDLRDILSVVKTKTENMPQGHLKVAVRPVYTEYYHIQDHGSSQGVYIPKKRKALAAQLAQKAYNLKLIKVLEHEINLLETCLKQTLEFSEIQNLYTGLSSARKSLVIPVTLSDEQYAEQWMNCTWQGKPFQDENVSYYTAKGERVRSKSEVIIADALFIENVPYRYEYPVKLKKAGKGEISLNPDFLCLNLRTREEVYWEHFGMMDDPDYLQNAIGKLFLYAENGLFPSHKLIITMETRSESLNTRDIKRVIQEYLK